MTSHGQDNYGRDITSHPLGDGVIRYSVTKDGDGILYIDRDQSVPFLRVLSTINAHAPSEG